MKLTPAHLGGAIISFFKRELKELNARVVVKPCEASDLLDHLEVRAQIRVAGAPYYAVVLIKQGTSEASFRVEMRGMFDLLRKKQLASDASDYR